MRRRRDGTGPEDQGASFERVSPSARTQMNFSASNRASFRNVTPSFPSVHGRRPRCSRTVVIWLLLLLLVPVWIVVKPPLIVTSAMCNIGLRRPEPGKKVVLVGHRGSEVGAPENTMAAALQGARSVGFIELDLTTSSEGKVMLMHDRTLERTTNGTGRPCERDERYLRSLVCKDETGGLTGYGVPALEDVFAALPREVNYMLDIKKCGRTIGEDGDCVLCSALVDGARRTLESFGIPLSQITFASSDIDSLSQFQKSFPDPHFEATYVLGVDLKQSSKSTAFILNMLDKGRLDGISAYSGLVLVRPDIVKAVQESRSPRTGRLRRVFGWTVRSSRDLRAVVCSGVREIVTGDPARFKKEIAEMLGENSLATSSSRHFSEY